MLVQLFDRKVRRSWCFRNVGISTQTPSESVKKIDSRTPKEYKLGLELC